MHTVIRAFSARLITAVLPIIGAALIVLPAPAAAHTRITDDSGRASAEIHISPDDRPEAGKPAEIQFYLDDIDPADFKTAILVAPQGGRAASLQTRHDHSEVFASYVFPSRGVYDITLRLITTTGIRQEFAFRTTFRIDRGTTLPPAPIDSKTKPALIVILIAAAAAGGIIGWNYRDQLRAWARKQRMIK